MWFRFKLCFRAGRVAASAGRRCSGATLWQRCVLQLLRGQAGRVGPPVQPAAAAGLPEEGGAPAWLPREQVGLWTGERKYDLTVRPLTSFPSRVTAETVTWRNKRSPPPSQPSSTRVSLSSGAWNQRLGAPPPNRLTWVPRFVQRWWKHSDAGKKMILWLVFLIFINPNFIYEALFIQRNRKII